MQSLTARVPGLADGGCSPRAAGSCRPRARPPRAASAVAATPPLTVEVAEAAVCAPMAAATRAASLPSPAPSPADGGRRYDALRRIQDPDFGQDIVACGFVKLLSVDPAAGRVSFTLELTTPARGRAGASKGAGEATPPPLTRPCCAPPARRAPSRTNSTGKPGLRWARWRGCPRWL